MSEVIVLNNAYAPIGSVCVEKAICLIYLDKAYTIKDSDRVVRSVNKEYPIPIAIVMPEAKYIKAKEMSFSKRAVYKRDGYSCVYCRNSDRQSLTLDHVIPKVRWKEIQKKLQLQFGLNSFQNCVTACKECNQKKSDKLLSELGWKEIEPKSPLSNLEIDWSMLMD